MKRLVANKDVIIDWVESNRISNSDIDTFMVNNPEYIYNGIAYRYIGLDSDNIFRLFGGYNFMDGNDDIVSREEVFSKVKSIIDLSDDYVSFAKTLDAAIEYSESSVHRDIDMIIKSSVSGIDVEKYLEQLENYEYDLSEEEVIAKMGDFEIELFLGKTLSEWPESISYDDLANSIYDNSI